jgi:putative chitinase
MAQQYTPEEIAEIFEAYNNAIKTGTPITADLARQMQDASKGIKGAADELNKFGKSLGTSALGLGKSLYKGEKGVGQFGDAVELAANAIQTAILAIPGIGIAAKLATVAMVALAKGVNAAAKQGDALYKSYQDLSRAGATASDGISGVFRNMQNLGYEIEELDKMVQLVAQNSETLAKFSLTAADGTNAFAQGMAKIQRDGDLRLLGKTTDDINSAGAAFIRQSVRAGMSQKDIGDKLGAQTKAYVLELDRLQRLTGMSADALQKQQDEAMAEDAYNDVMSELKQRAAAGDEVAKMQIEKITTVMNKLGPEMRKEFIAGIGGDVSAQQRLFMAAPNLMKDTMDETANTQQTINNLNKDAANTVNTFGKSARLAAGAFRDTFGPLYELRETMVSTADFDARTEAAKKNGQVTDSATKSLTEAQIANINSTAAMQSMVQLGVAPATAALAALAKAASAVTGTTAKVVGAPGTAAVSNTTASKDYPTDSKQPVQPRPQDPLKAQVWDSKYAKSWNPDGSAKKATAAPAVEPKSGSGRTSDDPRRSDRQPAVGSGVIDTELLEKLARTGITGKREQANILAQIQAESGGVAQSENLNYSPERLLKKFPKYVKNMEDAQQLVKQGPEAVGNRVYGGRKDLGNAADEGYKYRGRGIIQITGKYNYKKYGDLIGQDLVNNPDLANDPGIAKDIAAAYFKEKQKQKVDLSDIGAVGKAVGYVDIDGQETRKRAEMAAQIESQLPQARDGGTLTGPTSGYAAMLHGTEAVVPLPNGKTIPVEMAGFSNNFADQTSLMSQQLEKLDELVRVMQNQVNVSNKILQAAN